MATTGWRVTRLQYSLCLSVMWISWRCCSNSSSPLAILFTSRWPCTTPDYETRLPCDYCGSRVSWSRVFRSSSRWVGVENTRFLFYCNGPYGFNVSDNNKTQLTGQKLHFSEENPNISIIFQNILAFRLIVEVVDENTRTKIFGRKYSKILGSKTPHFWV